MDVITPESHVVIAPQIVVPLEPHAPCEPGQETPIRQAEIPMLWIQDGGNFRLDINLPDSSVLDLFFSAALSSLHINGETIWENDTAHPVKVTGAHVEKIPAGLRLTCTSGGSLHILARHAPAAKESPTPPNLSS